MDKLEIAIERIKAGKMVIMTDDEQRENEGDLVIAAEKITPESIAFMVNYGGGLVCLPMKKKKLEDLGIPLMVAPQKNMEYKSTAFTVSIDAATGISTGISAADRARTIKVAIAEESTAKDIVMPGHIFPLQARERGVLDRQGHTEGSVDLVTIAGLNPSAVICEIMSKDGTMMRGKNLEEFSSKFDIPIISISEILHYRKQELIDKGIGDISPVVTIPTNHGNFEAFSFTSNKDDKEHLVLMKNLNLDNSILVRIHSECLTGDVFRSLKCDCYSQLNNSLSEISKAGSGILIYLRQEGRGIGLINKLRAYDLQEKGHDTVTANTSIGCSIDNRDYQAACDILQYLQVKSIKLMTNNTAKLQALSNIWKSNLIRIPLPPLINKHNKSYIETKINKLNHLINLSEGV